MVILLEDSAICIWRTVLIHFFLVLLKCVPNERVLPTFFMLAKTFYISLFCIVTYQNITPDISTITRLNVTY